MFKSRPADRYSWIQLFRERLSRKVHATILKGIVGGFEFSFFFSKKIERIVTKGHWIVFTRAKESNKSRFDIYSRQKQCIDHIPYYFAGLSRAHFFRQPSRNSCMFSVVPSSNPLPYLASYQLGFLTFLCFIWIIGSLYLWNAPKGERIINYVYH